MPLRYVFGQDETVAYFVAQMIAHVRRRGFGKACKTIGIADANNELIAGLVYHNLDDAAGVIEISGAALPGYQWATRETLRMLHQYPFRQCGCQMVVMRVAADNERLLRQLLALGYELIAFPRLFGREADGVLCRLTDDVWAANKIAQRLERREIDLRQQGEAA